MLKKYNNERGLVVIHEIMRADTASAATRERYRKLSIEYLSHFDKDDVK